MVWCVEWLREKVKNERKGEKSEMSVGLVLERWEKKTCLNGNLNEKNNGDFSGDFSEDFSGDFSGDFH